MEWFDPQHPFSPATGLGIFVWAVVIFAAAIVVSRILGKTLKRSQWVIGRLGRKVDPTIISFAVRLKTVFVYLAAAVVFISLVPQLRGLLGTLVAGAGITAVIFGFAAKSSLANIMSGLSLAVYRPFRIGDKVSLENEYGTIEDITLRHTIVRTWENKRMIIPNEKIDSMTVLNHSIIDPKIMLRVEFGVSYDTDIDLARRVMLETTQACPQRMSDAGSPDQPYVRVISLGDFSIGLRLYIWVANMDDAWAGRWWLIENIKKRFDAEGIEIPFPYRTLVYKKDLPPARREKPDQEPTE